MGMDTLERVVDLAVSVRHRCQVQVWIDRSFKKQSQSKNLYEDPPHEGNVP